MNVSTAGNYYPLFPSGGRANRAVQGQQSTMQEQLPDIDCSETDGFLQPSWGTSLSFKTPKTDKGSQFVDFTEDNVSGKAQELASLMTETPIGTEVNLVRGMNMQQLANLCGGIGKQLDAALSKGDISEQEYADLNKALFSYTSFMTEKAENKNAMVDVLRQTDEELWKKIVSGASDQEVENYAQQIKNSWSDRICAFLKDNSYDRTILNQMIADIRTGKTLSFHAMA